VRLGVFFRKSPKAVRRQSVNTLRAGVRYFHTSDFGQKTAVFGCLTDALAPPPIALESCSMAQMLS